MSEDIIYIDYKINDYISLRLKNNFVCIYVGKKEILKYTRIFFQKVFRANEIFKDFNVRDQAINEKISNLKVCVYDQNKFKNRTPSQLFGIFLNECKIIKEWINNDYYSEFLRINDSFQLLRALYEKGEPKAKRIFKERIVENFLRGEKNVIEFLVRDKYLSYLEKDEFDFLISNVQERADPILWKNLGLYYKEQNESSKAIEAFEYALSLNAQDYENYVYLGNLYEATVKLSLAAELYRKGIEIIPNNSVLWASLGALYLKEGLNYEAIKTLKKTVEINSSNDIYWGLLAGAYQNVYESQNAIDACKKAIKINPKIESYWIILGRSYLSNSKTYRKAKIAFKKALALNPNNVITWFLLGYALYRGKEYREAVKTFMRCLKINDKLSNTWYYLGCSYYYTKEYNNALNSFKKAMELDSKNPKYLEYIGKCYYKLNDFHKAEEIFKEGTKKFPIYEGFLKSLSKLYFDSKNYYKAFEIYDKSFDLDYDSLYFGKYSKYYENLIKVDNSIGYENDYLTCHTKCYRRFQSRVTNKKKHKYKRGIYYDISRNLKNKSSKSCGLIRLYPTIFL